MSELLPTVVLALYAGVLGLLLPFAVHRTWLLLRSRRPEPGESRAPWAEEELPRVTVQLPVFNERHVAERLVDAACALDYPRRLLDIQVLDDSDDDTTERVAAAVRRWRARGVDVRHLRRETREGFKAGALAAGCREAEGDFLLVLDADFVPPPELVRRLLPPFRDPDVGMVQARWDHLNEEERGLTRAQALLLDGHFFFEHGGRYRGGAFFNFNGTAGMWRRACLEEGGGWQSDTLTEDLDLSYRAQMEGWRFVFLEDVGVPAELPSTVGALEVQQRRWAQGGIQTARKVLPRLLRGRWSWTVKGEAVFHLLGHLAHPLTVALGLLLFPAAVARRSLGLEHLLWLDLPLFLAATGPFFLFYGAAGRKRRRRWRELATGVVRTLGVGIGLGVPVSRAVLRGFRRREDPFVRTPKRGASPASSYRGWSLPGDSAMRLTLGVVLLACFAAAVAGSYWSQLPFLALFAGGHLGLGLPALRERWRPAGPDPACDEEQEDREPDEEPSLEGLRPEAGLLVGT